MASRTWAKDDAGIYRAVAGGMRYTIKKRADGWVILRGNGYAGRANTLKDAKSVAEKVIRNTR